MKRNLLLMMALITYALTHTAVADEHPTEHPKGPEAGAAPEHPKGGEAEAKTEHPADTTNKAPEHPTQGGKAPKKKKSRKAAEPTSWNRESVEKGLVTFIDGEKAKQNGIFVVKDEVTTTNRNLTLEKIHTDKIVKLDDGTSFVCADFKDESGETLDVDFFMTPTKNGAVEAIKKIQVHKVNGAARYTYVNRKGTWVQQSVN